MTTFSTYLQFDSVGCDCTKLHHISALHTVATRHNVNHHLDVQLLAEVNIVNFQVADDQLDEFNNILDVAGVSELLGLLDEQGGDDAYLYCPCTGCDAKRREELDHGFEGDLHQFSEAAFNISDDKPKFNTWLNTPVGRLVSTVYYCSRDTLTTFASEIEAERG